MINGSIVATLAGVSGLISLLSLLAYFLISATGEDAKPFDVRQRDIPPSLLKSLKGLSEDAKIRLLQLHMQIDATLAESLLKRSERFNPNTYAAGSRKSRDRRLLWTSGLFAVFAVVGLLAQTPPPHPPDPLPPVPTPQPPDPPKPVLQWKDTRPSGTKYSQEFKIKTHNRHNMSQVGQTGFIEAKELTDPPGAEKRITGAAYRCEGHGNRCSWSMNPSGGVEISVKLSEDKKTLTWSRSWDGDEVYDVYTVFYEVWTCVEHCN